MHNEWESTHCLNLLKLFIGVIYESLYIYIRSVCLSHSQCILVEQSIYSIVQHSLIITVDEASDTKGSVSLDSYLFHSYIRNGNMTREGLYIKYHFTHQFLCLPTTVSGRHSKKKRKKEVFRSKSLVCKALPLADNFHLMLSLSRSAAGHQK